MNLLSNLQSKDYIGIKIAMGVATHEDYADEITQTEAWRLRINEVLDEIAELEAITEFDDDDDRPMENA